MPCSDETGRQSAERARALLAVFDIQPPPDFEVQVLARVYALQAKRVSPPASYTRPLPCQRFSQSRRKACWQFRPRLHVSSLRLMACGLVVASAALLWCVSPRSLPAALSKEGRQARTSLKYDAASVGDGVDGSGHGTAVLQEVMVAAEHGWQPGTFTLQHSEPQRGEEELVQQEELLLRPEPPRVPGSPLWIRETPKLSAQPQEQRSGRQRSLRGKAKRSGKGLRLSRHVPA